MICDSPPLPKYARVFGKDCRHNFGWYIQNIDLCEGLGYDYLLLEYDLLSRSSRGVTKVDDDPTLSPK